MTTKPFMLSLLFAVAAFSCNTPDGTPKNGDAQLTASTLMVTGYVENEEDIDIAPYSYIRLLEDSTFHGAALRGYFAGKWSYQPKSKQIWMVPDSAYLETVRKQVVVMQVESLEGRSMKLSLMRQANGRYSEPFAKLDMTQGAGNPVKDPFNREFHGFRNKPLTAETPEQIKARVLNYLDFLEAFYRFSSENEITVPETDWFPTPVKMETTGSIRMAYSDELKDWNACFFNEEQAIEGYKLLSGGFLNVKLKSNKDIHLRNITVVEQLRNYINGKAK